MSENVPQLQAYVWWCGDDVCDCTQPVVELLLRHPTLGGNCTQRTQLWAGEFHSQAEPGESLEQIAELVFAASKYHIRLDPKTWSGERHPIPMATAIEYLERAGKLPRVSA